MLVIGHFNCFKIVCRRCFADLKGAQCVVCQLHERDVPRGTTIIANYKNVADGYTSTLRYVNKVQNEYLRFCNTIFPIFVNNVQVQPLTTNKTIAHATHFVCKQFDTEDDIGRAFYMIRTHAGVLMFSKRVWGTNSAPGYYSVELNDQVNFTMFDQARQDLVGKPGDQLRKFLSDRDGNHNNADVDKDRRIRIQGSSIHESLDILPQVPILAQESVVASSSSSSVIRPEIKSVDPDSVQSGPVECLYFFRGNKTMDNINAMWRPGQTIEQIYLLLSWTMALDEVFDAFNFVKPLFDVGFVFDSDTVAMKEGDVYYINPELLLQEVTNLGKVNRFKVLGYLLARAVHEVTHVEYHNHDAGFASCMTNGMAKVMTIELKGDKTSIAKKDLKLRRAAQQLFKSYKNELKAAAKHQHKKPKVKKVIPRQLKRGSMVKPRDVINLVDASDTESDDEEEEEEDDEDSSSDFDLGKDPEMVLLAMSKHKKKGVKRSRK
jgi:hypothetical protein